MSQSQQAQPSSTYVTPPAATAPGRFVWHDLMTTDAGRAVEFYVALFGWTATATPMGGGFGDYTMLTAGDEGVGGVVPLDAAHGVASHWIGYVAVPSVDAACERAAALGGQVCVPPREIPGIGRFAVVADPTGAVVSPFAFPGGEGPPERTGRAPDGVLVWDDLMTSDPEAAMRFHADLFGWRYEHHDVGPLGSYWEVRRGERGVGGVMALRPDAAAAGAGSHWFPYVQVADVDTAAARAAELGGTLCVPPTDIPGTGRFAVLHDPTGALVALFRGVEG